MDQDQVQKDYAAALKALGERRKYHTDAAEQKARMRDLVADREAELERLRKESGA